MSKSKTVLVITFLVTLLGLLACSKDIKCPPELVVISGAQRVSCHSLYSTIQLRYFLTEKYPANKVIEALNSHFKSIGWRQLNEDFLNPGEQASHTRGWVSMYDGTSNPPGVVHQWLGDWGNDNGDIVRFVLRYSPKSDGSSNSSNMLVFGILIPRDVVKQLALQRSKFGSIKP